MFMNKIKRDNPDLFSKVQSGWVKGLLEFRRPISLFSRVLARMKEICFWWNQ